MSKSPTDRQGKDGYQTTLMPPSAPDSLGGSGEPRLCKNGCGRRPFRTYPTCCTHCKGPEGPHAGDCVAKHINPAAKFKLQKSGSWRMFSGYVAMRIIKANLYRSFDQFGKMDPFAKAVLLPEGNCDSKLEIGRTRSHWGGHMTPEWDHMCRSFEYNGGAGDMIKISVLEENFGGHGTPTFCGEAEIPVDELLRGLSPLSDGVMSTHLKELDLMKKTENTGTITVQAVLHTDSSDESFVGKSSKGSKKSSKSKYSCELSVVDPALFVTPVKRLGVSGGTAPFFELELRLPDGEESVDHWIGKDLSRATDEIAFYEERASLLRLGGHGMDRLFQFMFEYAGVLQCKEYGVSDSPDLELLVLRNLRDQCCHLRMLDIKMGEKTAAAGWQGKSYFAALRQSVVDGVTNSSEEGFRLEGFDGSPPALKSMDPLLDFGHFREADETTKKKARRIQMQRMRASEMFMHFLDLHQVPEDMGDDDMQLHFAPIEYAEIVMSEIVLRLVELCEACECTPVPQKWIGSSVALGFDDDYLPARNVSEDVVRKSVRVYIFDWGRSELNTLSRSTDMSAAEQEDRLKYWHYYSGGCRRLALEAARFYYHRFGNADSWTSFAIDVFDFDSSHACDYIGKIELKAAPTPGVVSAQLLSKAGKPVKNGKGQPSTLTYSMVWRTMPQGSRLRGSWRLTIHKAVDLPVCDSLTTGSSDPFVSVFAYSSGGLVCKQNSCVISRSCNPEWNETFDYPVVANCHEVMDKISPFFEQVRHEVGIDDCLFKLLPSPCWPEDDASMEKAMQCWELCIRKATGRQSFQREAS